jgi:hypothetical protein
MKKQRTYPRLTLVLSVLFGIILPLVLGVKDLFIISLIFTSIWFVYAVATWAKGFFSPKALKARNLVGKRSDKIIGG